MRILTKYFLGFLVVFSTGENSKAEKHQHVKHNFVMMGQSEVFASHIVYRVPHNFQVILKVELGQKEKSIYLNERAAHPGEQFIFLADEMNIATIETVDSISGTLLRKMPSGQKTVLVENLKLKRHEFVVLFFNELPLSLE